jgi:hypothetical protein
MAAVAHHFYLSNAEDAYRIRAVELSDDVSDGDSIDDWTECDGDSVETREWIRRVQKTTSDDTAATIWKLVTVVSLE